MKRRTRSISLALSLCLILSLADIAALADAEPAEDIAVPEEVLSEDFLETESEPEAQIHLDPEPGTEEDAAAETPDTAEPEPEPAAESGPDAEPEPVSEPEAVFEDEPETGSSEPDADWVEPGNIAAELLAGGLYLRAEGGRLYYSDGGLWLAADGNTSFLSAEQGRNLNLSDGWLYYTVEGDVRRLPASGGTAETVYAFGAYIDELCVMGSELRFLSGGSVHSYDMGSGALETIAAPANLLGFIPTPYGNVFLTGAARDYTVWAGTDRRLTGVEQCYTDGDWLVVMSGGQTRQITLKALFDGSAEPEAYSLHPEMLAGNGLSDEEQLANEAAYLQTETYKAMQDGLSLSTDGAYTATNARIASTAYGSSSISNDQRNIVLRARQMAEVQWTPLSQRYSWGGDDSSYVNSHKSWGSRVAATDGSVTYGYFAAGKTYQGIPYSQAVSTGYVGWSLSIDDFVKAVNDSSSKFYSGYSRYSRTAPYYGSDCSGFVSWAWNLPFRCTCTSLLGYSAWVQPSVQNLWLGDSLNNPNSHVVLVTDLGYDANGNIISVEITEQTPSKMRVTCYGELLPGKTYEYTGTLSYITSYYLNGGYSIYRRLYDSHGGYSVGFTPSAAVDLEENGYAAAPSVSVAVNPDGSAKIVTLSHRNAGAVIYYTTDGSEPTKNSTRYTGPFEVRSAVTVRAMADCGEKYTGSYSVSYNVSVARAEKPFVVLMEGDMQDEYVSAGSRVSVINNAGDAIYYTTDGSEPTKNSTPIPDEGLVVSRNMTLKAVAVSNTDLNSEPVVLEVLIGQFCHVMADFNDGGYVTPGGTGVLYGSRAAFEIIPLEHYVISDVLADGQSVGKVTSYVFENVTADHTLTVRFAVALPFTDVSGKWYSESVSYVYARGLFAGTSATSFSPDTKMTRGMFITVLGRFAGYGQWTDLESWSGRLGVTNGSKIAVREITNTSDTSTILGRTGATGEHLLVTDGASVGLDGANWFKVQYGTTAGFIREKMPDSTQKTLLYAYNGAFSDLPNGAYFTGYAQWANIFGIMNGATDTTFSPNRYVTRQDICVLLYRYLTQYCGRTLSSSSSVFTDDAKIADYARTAVYAMKNIGVVSGYTDGSFRPGGYASRAEVAQIFKNLASWMGF